jgi:hypothetical protein
MNCEEDGCKNEWNNCYENDGTPDNSAWTSQQTDGQAGTSPSPNLQDVNEENIDNDSISSLTSQDEFINERVKESALLGKVTCYTCTYDLDLNR